MKSRLHRLRTQAELRRSLLDAHLLDVAQDEHDAKRIRQLIDGAFEQAANFRAGRRGFQVAALTGCRQDDHALSLPVDGVEVLQFDCRTPLSKPAERLVEGDARQPSRQACVASELPEMGESAHVSFLDCILGLALVAQHAARNP